MSESLFDDVDRLLRPVRAMLLESLRVWRDCLARQILRALLLTAVLFSDAYGTHLYRWVDNQGVTHYSERPPPEKYRKQVQELDIHTPAPSSPQPQSRESAKPTVVQRPESPAPAFVSKDDSGIPWPSRSESRFFSVFSNFSGARMRKGMLEVYQFITLDVKPALPEDILLVVHFEDAAGSGKPFIVEKERGSRNSLEISSPHMAGVRCQSYEIRVYVYQSKLKSKRLGSHQHMNRSMIDTVGMKSEREHMKAAEKAFQLRSCQRAIATKRSRGLSLEKYVRLHKGMTEQEVLKITGPPDDFELPMYYPRTAGAPSGPDKVLIYRSKGYNSSTTRIDIFKDRVTNISRTLH